MFEVMGGAARAAAVLALAAAMLIASPASAQARPEVTSRLIVKFKDPAATAAVRPAQRVGRLSADAAIELRHERSMALGAELMDSAGR